jgi:hypothetical protein
LPSNKIASAEHRLTRRLSQKMHEAASNVVSHTTKCRDPFLFRALTGSRVVKARMQTIRVAGINRAAFLGAIARGHDVTEVLIFEFVDGFSSDARTSVPQPTADHDANQPVPFHRRSTLASARTGIYCRRTKVLSVWKPYRHSVVPAHTAETTLT